MKKLISMYQKYMFRPILYKSVTRVSVVAVLMLLWDRYVSDGRFTMWQAPALLLGVVLLAWAWVNYLRLDGVTIHHLGEEFKDMGKKKKFHSTKSIVDFADERIVSFEELEPEVRDHEPRGALDGTADGLYFYRILAEECAKHLTPGGHVYFEIGYDQGAAVKELLDIHGFKDTRVIQDLTGKDRVVCGAWQTAGV